jgi:hypothetical protein
MKIQELEAIVEKQGKLIEELSVRLEKLETRKGPASQREMTLEDAERIINGDLKETSHKKAAEILGLSYGQVYSARGGYTFKTVQKARS